MCVNCGHELGVQSAVDLHGLFEKRRLFATKIDLLCLKSGTRSRLVTVNEKKVSLERQKQEKQIMQQTEYLKD